MRQTWLLEGWREQRKANVLRFEQVKAVVLETTGDISVLHSADPDSKLEAWLLKEVRGKGRPFFGTRFAFLAGGGNPSIRRNHEEKRMHTLMKLTYGYDALEPHIDAKTMEIHHTKHHQSYVDKLNGALERHPDLQSRSVVDLISNLGSVPEDIRTVVRNNGGGHANHSLFFTLMEPGGSVHPQGSLAAAIDRECGGWDAFQQAFTEAAVGRFGSGWAWLSRDHAGKLIVESTPNQDNPLMSGRTPLLGLDVWEHAYYLNYQNRRPDYISAWWNVVNWDKVAGNYEAQLPTAAI